MSKISSHYSKEREAREKLIIQLGGDGKPIKEVVVDRGHKNGKEIHIVTDNAVVIIKNKDSGKLVTKLIARPQQIRRYIPNISPVSTIIKKATERMRLGYNK